MRVLTEYYAILHYSFGIVVFFLPALKLVATIKLSYISPHNGCYSPLLNRVHQVDCTRVSSLFDEISLLAPPNCDIPRPSISAPSIDIKCIIKQYLPKIEIFYSSGNNFWFAMAVVRDNC